MVDNLCNSNRESLSRVQSITGRSLQFAEMDLLDKPALKNLFNSNNFKAVMHFAGLKAVGESVTQPMRYYRNNLLSTMNLLEVMGETDTTHLVFSSSATVYGLPEMLPLTENAKTGPTNPYGKTKWMIEHMLEDFAATRADASIACLRYFNPVGAHESGEIGEDPQDIPNNLMPYVSQVAIGRREKVSVYGNDYDTVDGTGVRDYIHVVDLVRGHLKALDFLEQTTGFHVFNLGTGRGYSVLEMIRAFEQASGCQIPYEVTSRRSGDVATCYADASKANRELGWRADLDVDSMCADTWRWQQKNPEGFN